MSIVFGTGHRPKFFPCGYNEDMPWALSVKAELRQRLQAVKPDHVISGMAIGWDTWLAEEAIKLRIPVHAYVPFEGQGKKWPKESQKRYQNIIDRAEKVITISRSYSNDAFLKRDEAMVDNADIGFILWNPEVKTGGTYYTKEYAIKNKKPLVNFWR